MLCLVIEAGAGKQWLMQQPGKPEEVSSDMLKTACHPPLPWLLWHSCNTNVISEFGLYLCKPKLCSSILGSAPQTRCPSLLLLCIILSCCCHVHFVRPVIFTTILKAPISKERWIFTAKPLMPVSVHDTTPQCAYERVVQAMGPSAQQVQLHTSPPGHAQGNCRAVRKDLLPLSQHTTWESLPCPCVPCPSASAATTRICYKK
jgi:hypothetical protein